MSAVLPAADAPLLISVRECRVTVERVLLVAGVSGGLLPAAADLAVAAEIAGGEGLALLEREVVPGSVGEPRLALRETLPSCPVLEAHGASSLIALPAVLDLACAAAPAGRGLAAGLDVDHAGLAAGVPPLAARRGRSAAVAVLERGAPVRLDGDASAAVATQLEGLGRKLLEDAPGARTCVVVSVEPPEPARDDAVARLAGDPATAGAILAKIPVAAALWWSLYERSEQALTPASERSRLDTGVVPEAPDDH
jgi:hypothetical protein